MTGVELGLAIVATIELCFKHGETLRAICNSFKDAESEFAERILCIESHWKRTTLQIAFFQRVWQSLDEEHQRIQNQVLQVLISKLTIAISKMEGFVGESKSILPFRLVRGHRQPIFGLKKFKYALLRESLDSTIEDLKSWQEMFDPPWYLMLMTSSPKIDTELARQIENSPTPLLSSTRILRNALRGNEDQAETIWRREEELRCAHVEDIRYSSLKIARWETSTRVFVLNPVPFPSQGIAQNVTADVRELARKLRHTDPGQFGLLTCYGVVREKLPQSGQPISFTFVFKTVEASPIPQSLRAHLLFSEPNHSLSERLTIAKQLAKSVSFVHTFGFVHKNIRPEVILLSTDTPSSLGTLYLVGFEEFRNAEGHSLRFGNSAWEKNLYQHPRRQGPRPDDYYIMQHDIYSLGVCLLEVGLFTSFVHYNDDGTLVPSSGLRVLSERLSTWEPVQVKDLLVSLARTSLPTRMGTKYSRIVETCLTCLDEDNSDFGDESEFHDADGVLVAVRYIDKILLQLETISM